MGDSLNGLSRMGCCGALLRTDKRDFVKVVMHGLVEHWIRILCRLDAVHALTGKEGHWPTWPVQFEGDSTNLMHDVDKYRRDTRGPWNHVGLYVTLAKDVSDIKGPVVRDATVMPDGDGVLVIGLDEGDGQVEECIADAGVVYLLQPPAAAVAVMPLALVLALALALAMSMAVPVLTATVTPIALDGFHRMYDGASPVGELELRHAVDDLGLCRSQLGKEEEEEEEEEDVCGGRRRLQDRPCHLLATLRRNAGFF
ncbi:hypothetical protein BHM03_00040238 [Ensete ventricosum]|nr:hypothetical protein BHM03_00040238 [Ensete ventricosum]